MRILAMFLVVACLLAGCAAASTANSTVVPSPTTVPTVKPNPLFTSNGHGEPRTIGYWLLWNSCAEGNQSATARANGGRASGWVVMDDLLVDPGIMLGAVPVESCTYGVNLLQGNGRQGINRQGDAAYALATQLLTAQLNLASGSEYCAASDQAVQAAQLLLLGLKFDGTKGYLAPPSASLDRETAIMLTEQLANYNSGTLCVP